MFRIVKLLLLCLLALPALPALAEEAAARIVLPPPSLAGWYPPQKDKPEFFLHMLGLGRAMQAASEYAVLQDQPRLVKWAERLTPAYRRVATMVPEWEGEIELQWADRLLAAARAADYATVDKALDRIGTSCRSCHNEYRPAVRVLYHVPDYQQALVEDSDSLEEVPYPKVMGALARDMNRIAIATEDGRREVVSTAAESLVRGARDLGASCAGCHGKDAVGDRLFAEAPAAFDVLLGAVDTGDGPQVSAALNRIGGGYCTACHAIHKPAAVIRAELAKGK
jgi:cytochrome c553